MTGKTFRFSDASELYRTFHREVYTILKKGSEDNVIVYVNELTETKEYTGKPWPNG